MKVNRRSFIKASLAAGAFPLLPACFGVRRYSANEKVRLACVGIGHQAWEDIRKFGKTGLCKIVALCDTDLSGPQCEDALSEYPDVPRFTDFRKMMDAMVDNADAVAVMTPDHSHFPAVMDALRHGFAVFCEKPLCHTFLEHELLLAAAKRAGVVTQMGNQGHSEANLHQFRHYVETGVLDPSKIVKLVAHMNNGDRRWYKYDGQVSGYPEAEAIPAGFDWDVWQAGVPDHDYSSQYMRGEWRSWYDFGSGCLGDWGAHTMDTMHRFFDLGLPTAVKISDVKGWNPYVFPLQDTLTFSFAAKGRRPAVDLEWREGPENLPELPVGYEKGFCLRGSYVAPGKIITLSDGTSWQGSSHGATLFRCGDGFEPDYPAPETGPLSHYENFLLSVRGDAEPNSPFEVAVPLCEVFSLGIVAQRLNRGFGFDPVAKRATDDPEANILLRGPEPREEWAEFYA